VAVSETSLPSKHIWLSNVQKINDLSYLFRCDTCCTISMTMVWQVSIWTLYRGDYTVEVAAEWTGNIIIWPRV